MILKLIADSEYLSITELIDKVLDYSKIKEELKMFLFADDMILHIENPRKLLSLVVIKPYI